MDGASLREIEQFLTIFKEFPDMQVLTIGDRLESLIKPIEQKFNIELDSIDSIKLEPKIYNYVILFDRVDLEILEKSYYALKRYGNLMLIAKKGEFELFSLQELMEKRGFKSLNSIDIFEEFDLFIANKQESWVRSY